MQSNIIFRIKGGKMTKEQIEQEWQKELSKFLEYHSKKMKNMSEEESNKYIKENKVNEKLQDLQNQYKELLKNGL